MQRSGPSERAQSRMDAPNFNTLINSSSACQRDFFHSSLSTFNVHTLPRCSSLPLAPYSAPTPSSSRYFALSPLRPNVNNRCISYRFGTFFAADERRLKMVGGVTFAVYGCLVATLTPTPDIDVERPGDDRYWRYMATSYPFHVARRRSVTLGDLLAGAKDVPSGCTVACILFVHFVHTVKASRKACGGPVPPPARTPGESAG